MRSKIFPVLLVACAAVTAHGSSAARKGHEDMVFVPGGYFLMGSDVGEVDKVKREFGSRDLYKDYPFDEETPKRRVYIKPFYIDRHEVTNREYAEFVHATGWAAPSSWQGGKYPAGKDDYPVLYVSQKDAEAYARWAGKRLPTEAEWEKAARGVDGRVYPWGNEFDPYKSATADSDIRYIYGALCSIGSANRIEIAEGDVSPYGVRDMAGNVREWTASAAPGEPSMAVVKGASWVDLSITARAASRAYVPKNSRSHIIGFRCVKDLDDEPGL